MSSLKSAARFVMHRLREAALYPDLLSGRKGRRVLVLQNTGRETSGLLRGYEIAERLNRRGWSCTVVPKQLDLGQRKRVLRLFDPDMVLLLTSRDPKNSHELLQGYPYLYDLDDADFVDPKLTERVAADVAAARGVIAGSRFVAEWCSQYNDNTRIIWTGSRPRISDWTPHSQRKRVLTWAQADPVGYPKEFDLVVEVMTRLAERQDGLTFRLYGGDGTGDEGRTDFLRSKGIDVEWMPLMSYGEFLRSLDDVAIGFSPICIDSPFSRGKSFGKILTYLDARVPVITSDEVDHAEFFTPETGIVSNDLDVWVAEAEALLQSPEIRDLMAQKAHEAFLRDLSLETAANKVESFILETLHGDLKALGGEAAKGGHSSYP